MWSGPRNLSTALMRSFSSRDDTVVLDEPFYAHYLHHTSIAHPGRDQVIAAYETDWRKVVDYISGPVPDGRTVWYQKHMAHHMLPHTDVGIHGDAVSCLESDDCGGVHRRRSRAEAAGGSSPIRTAREGRSSRPRELAADESRAKLKDRPHAEARGRGGNAGEDDGRPISGTTISSLIFLLFSSPGLRASA